MQTGRQTITVDSVTAAKRATAKIIDGARKRLRPHHEVLSSSDEEMYNFASSEVTDEAILRQEAYKRKNAVDKRIERRAMSAKRLEELQQRVDSTNRKLQEAKREKQRLLRRKRQAVDPLPDTPYWPEFRPSPTERVWLCPRFPGAARNEGARQLLFKMAVDLDERCLKLHDALSGE